jgi:hypothetical protein
VEIAWLIVLGMLGWFAMQIVKGYRSDEPPAPPNISGGYRVEVVGESQYQDALEAICGGRTRDGAQNQVTATVVLEDSNPYDENAVRVDISGRTVGYLSRQAAKTYRRRLKQVGASGQSVECSAVIRGGWDRGRNDRGHFGVWLDLRI